MSELFSVALHVCDIDWELYVYVYKLKYLKTNFWKDIHIQETWENYRVDLDNLNVIALLYKRKSSVTVIGLSIFCLTLSIIAAF